MGYNQDRQVYFPTIVNPTQLRARRGVTIGEYAFSGCAKLYSMSLPYDSVKDIGQSAFAGCASLRSVTMPKGIVAVKDNTFNGCTLLNKVKMAKGITSIGTGAFQNCTNLKDFTIPKAVRSIGASAFMNTSLTYAEISDKVRTIDTSTFQNCRKLSSATIAGGVKGKIVNVRDYAFAGCTSLKASVTIRVPAVPATKVAITAPSKTVKIGKTLQLKASLTPSDATDRVTWKSSNAKLAKVSQTGKVTGVKKGTVTITATAASGKTASVKITVN